jgi:hypothetical protein
MSKQRRLNDFRLEDDRVVGCSGQPR